MLFCGWLTSLVLSLCYGLNALSGEFGVLILICGLWCVFVIRVLVIDVVLESLDTLRVGCWWLGDIVG